MAEFSLFYGLRCGLHILVAECYCVVPPPNMAVGDLAFIILYIYDCNMTLINAAVNCHFEPTLLKGRQRFDAISKSNFEVF